MRTRGLIQILLLFGMSSARGGIAREEEFKPIFDGRTLSGWSTPNMSYWSVSDGAITARSTRENPCKENQFLAWQGGTVSDFELKLSFRIRGPESTNAGVQFRSAIQHDGHAVGYQADIARDPTVTGTLYDEHSERGLLASRGQSVVIDEEGHRTMTMLSNFEDPGKSLALDRWNEYHIIARGHHLTLMINGKITCDVMDWDRSNFDSSGKLALQLHSGPPTTVQYKNIRLKMITTPEFQLEPGFVRLDNGKDLDGWQGDLTGWSVKDGAIHLDAASAKGNIYHGATHSRNCVIRLQFRATRGADSGVFVHGNQLQVRDYPNAGPAAYAGPCKPAGEWNELEWNIVDGVAVVKLNGQVIEQAWAIGSNELQGIGLQKETGDFDFRYIRIREKKSRP